MACEMHGYCRIPREVRQADGDRHNRRSRHENVRTSTGYSRVGRWEAGYLRGPAAGDRANIWFSNVKEVPGNLTMQELMHLIGKQLFDKLATLQ